MVLGLILRFVFLSLLQRFVPPFEADSGSSEKSTLRDLSVLEVGFGGFGYLLGFVFLSGKWL